MTVRSTKASIDLVGLTARATATIAAYASSIAVMIASKKLGVSTDVVVQHSEESWRRFP